MLSSACEGKLLRTLSEAGIGNLGLLLRAGIYWQLLAHAEGTIFASEKPLVAAGGGELSDF